VLDPPVESLEQFANIGFPVVVPPAADDRVDYRYHFPQLYRRTPECQVSDLLLQPCHRLLARHSIKTERVGLAGPLLR